MDGSFPAYLEMIEFPSMYTSKDVFWHQVQRILKDYLQFSAFIQMFDIMQLQKIVIR